MRTTTLVLVGHPMFPLVADRLVVYLLAVRPRDPLAARLGNPLAALAALLLPLPARHLPQRKETLMDL